MSSVRDEAKEEQDWRAMVEEIMPSRQYDILKDPLEEEAEKAERWSALRSALRCAGLQMFSLERMKNTITVVCMLVAAVAYVFNMPHDPFTFLSISPNVQYLRLLHPPYDRIWFRFHALHSFPEDVYHGFPGEHNEKNQEHESGLSSHKLSKRETLDVEAHGAMPTPYSPSRRIFVVLEGFLRNASTWYMIDRRTSVLDNIDDVSDENFFDVYQGILDLYNSTFRLGISSNYSFQSWPVKLELKQLQGRVRHQVWIAAIILILVYILIVFELFHRTVAALIGSFLGLGALSWLQHPPTFLEVVSWIDMETIGLLFGMMIMVGIFSQTGIFEWMAVRAYKYSGGDVWKLTVILCVLTAVLSSVLDNVTTILLIAPVTIRLCSVLETNPKPILIAEVIFSNIGGTATPIGDPPNIIIVNSPLIQETGEINFTNFTFHVGIGIIFTVVASMYFMKWSLGMTPQKLHPVSSKQQELEVWKKTVTSLHPSTVEEVSVKVKMENFVANLEQEMKSEPRTEEMDIKDLEEKYQIHDKELFIGSCIVLLSVILLFFIHSAVPINLSLVWIAIIGCMIHIIISGIHELELLLEKVEWGTLLFFAGLFVLMKALEEMGLIAFVGEVTAHIVESVPPGRGRLAVAILLLLWVSALVSAFIDNIPYMTTMVPIVKKLSTVGLPLTPLVWAICFGACLGGNGTIIGASANVVCCGLAEGQGHPISFNYFFKIGFPVMLISMLVATVYMLLTHVLIPWY